MENLSNISALLVADSKGVKVLRILVVIVIFLASIPPSVDLGMKLFSSWFDEPYNTNISDSPNSVSTVAIGDQLKIEVLPLFGELDSDDYGPPQASIAVEQAPVSSANNTQLSLQGVIGSVAQGKALAIITSNGRKGTDGPFAIGEALPGGAVLDEIYFDSVVVSYSGKRQTLFIEDDGKIITGKVRQSSGSTTVVKRSTDQSIWDIDKNSFKKQLSDLGSLSKKVGVQVYKENSLQKGYRLTSKRGVLLRELGLRPGDIVLEINGTKLTNAALGIKAYRILQKSSQVRLRIKRRGVEKRLEYNIK